MSLATWSTVAGVSEGDESAWIPRRVLITAGLLRHCAEESFRKWASALEGLGWEIQKLQEQEVFNHFLNGSCNYRLCSLLCDNFIEYYVRFEPRSLISFVFFFFTTCHFRFCQHWKVTLMVSIIISIAFLGHYRCLIRSLLGSYWRHIPLTMWEIKWNTRTYPCPLDIYSVFDLRYRHGHLNKQKLFMIQMLIDGTENIGDGGTRMIEMMCFVWRKCWSWDWAGFTAKKRKRGILYLNLFIHLFSKYLYVRLQGFNGEQDYHSSYPQRTGKQRLNKRLHKCWCIGILIRWDECQRSWMFSRGCEGRWG